MIKARLIAGVVALSACALTAQQAAIALAVVGQETENPALLAARGRYDEAIEILNARLAKQATREDYQTLADVYIQSGAGLAAEAAIDRARALGADYAASAVILSKAKLLQQKYQDALDVLQGVTIAQSDRGPVLIIRADANFALGDAETAQRQYQEAAKLDPKAFEPSLGLARIALRNGKLDQARDFAQQALALSSGNTMALYTLGLLARYSGDNSAAKSYFEQSVSAFPDNALARLELVALRLDQGNIEAAETELDRVFEITRSNPRARYMSAVIMAEKGEFEASHQLLNSLRSITDRFLPAAYVRGMVAYQVNRDDIAQEYLSRVLRARPVNRPVRLALASVENRLGRPQVALRILSPLLARGAADAEALALAGTAAARAGDAAASAEYVARAEKLGVSRGAEVLPDIASKLALAQVSAGAEDAAIETLSTLVSSKRADIRHLGILADVQLRGRDYAAAKATADRLVAIAPDRGLGYNILGTIAHSQRQYKSAIELYTQALDRNAQYYTARRNRGLAYLAMLAFDNAEKDLEALLRATPEDARAKAALGKTKLELGKYEQAVSLFEAASRVLTRSPDLMVDLISARARAGYTAQAIRESRAVMRRVSERPDLLRRMGLLFLELKQPQLAARPLARYQAFNPQSFEASLLHGRALYEAGLLTGSKLHFVRASVLASAPAESGVADWYLFAVDVGLGNQAGALAKLPSLDFSQRPDLVSPALVAEVYLLDGQYDAALQAFGALFATDKSPQVSLGYARTLWELQRRADAIKILEESRASSSEFDASLIEALASYYVADGRQLEAQLALERLISETGGSPQSLLVLAQIYLAEGNVDSVRLAEQAYLIAPNDPATLSAYGWVLLQGARDVERAFQVLEKASKREPGNALYRYRLGMAQLARGNDLFARDSLRAALSLDPDFEFAEQARQTLNEL